ncbi:MAG TPA: aspartate/glutamate racemase family protein, partial [Dongiaceae bacterium]
MIGLFDSGYGGLTILSALHARLPFQSFLYLGDNGNAPYGRKPAEEIHALTEAGVARLFDLGARLVILACNSATATALRPLQQVWLPAHHPNRRILGIIAPMVEEIARNPWHSKAGPDEEKRPIETVAIFATPATVASGFYVDEIRLRAPRTQVAQQACPELAGMIEAGAQETELRPVVERHVAALLRQLDGKAPDNAVLGCTHFPLIEPLFRAALPPETRLLSQPARVVASMVAYLFRHPEMKDFARHHVEPRCLTTGDPDRVTALASRFYGRHLPFESVDSTAQR